MAEMDIERFVEAPGRDEKIKQVRTMIDSMGIEYLYLQFVSVTGKIMGKGCLLYTSPSPRDQRGSRMPSSA